MTRDRGLAQLRPFDVEQMLTAAALTGAALTGLLVAGGTWPWMIALAAIIVWIPPTRRWLRARRGTPD